MILLSSILLIAACAEPEPYAVVYESEQPTEVNTVQATIPETEPEPEPEPEQPVLSTNCFMSMPGMVRRFRTAVSQTTSFVVGVCVVEIGVLPSCTASIYAATSAILEVRLP